MRKFIESIILSLRLMFTTEHWKNQRKSFVALFLGTIGLCYSFIQIVDSFLILDNSHPLFAGKTYFLIIVSFSLLVALYLARPRLKMSSKIADTDIFVSLQIGNILYNKGDFVLSTNTTFDTTADDGFILPESLQWQLFKMEYDNIEHLNSEIDVELGGVNFTSLTGRNTKLKRYPVGTVIKLKHRSGKRSYWLAMADVNQHGKPDARYENLYTSLEELWKFLEKKGHMVDLYIPILGSGKTGLNEKRTRIVKDIILSFLVFSREKKIVNSLIICFHPKDFFGHNIDLYELYEYMDYQCRFGADGKDIISSSTGI